MLLQIKYALIYMMSVTIRLLKDIKNEKLNVLLMNEKSKIKLFQLGKIKQ